MTAPTKQAHAPEWHIDRQAHGLFLLQDNYCVAKLLDGEADAVRMFDAIDRYDADKALLAELTAALREIAKHNNSAGTIARAALARATEE